MSEDGATAAAPAKRGRKSNAEKAADKEKTEKAEKAEQKKRARKPADGDSGEGGDDDTAPPKRGRGRPKGSTKKKNAAPAKPKAKSGGGKFCLFV